MSSDGGIDFVDSFHDPQISSHSPIHRYIATTRKNQHEIIIRREWKKRVNDGVAPVVDHPHKHGRALSAIDKRLIFDSI
jgi:hypothetical protein